MHGSETQQSSFGIADMLLLTLAGYAVECAPKACISRQFRAKEIPDSGFVRRIHTHDLSELVKLAGLQHQLDQQRNINAQFETYWNVIRDWKPERRYLVNTSRAEARDLYNAATDPQHGILRWLRQHW